MKFPAAFIFYFLFILIGSLQAQNSDEHKARINTIIANYHKEHKAQKIYIHTDKNFYYTGDTLWFKSYVLNASTNQLDTASEVLFFDIFDQESRNKKMYFVQSTNGQGSGSYIIPSDLHSGNWQIIAYTNEMRNYDESFYFRKNIFIVNNPQQDSILDNSAKLLSYEKKRLKRKAKRIVPSYYWFYNDSLKKYSLNLLLKNKLNGSVSTNGNFVSKKQSLSFQTNAKGMTSISNINANENAYLKINKKKYKINKSETLDNFRIVDNGNKISILLASEENEVRFIALFSNGNLNQLFDLNEQKVADILIDKSSMIDGTTWFCLLSSSYKVLFEQAYYKTPQLKVELSNLPDLLVVKFNLKEAAKLSVSIYNEPEEFHLENNSIYTSVYIDQEAEPYFASNNYHFYANKSVYNFPQLLSQKWTTDKFESVKSIEITGKVVRMMNIGLPNKTIRLSNSEDYYSTSVQQTGNRGKFNFPITNSIDSSYLLIDAVRDKGANNLAIQLDTVSEFFPLYKNELTIDAKVSDYQTINTNSEGWLIPNTQMLRMIEERNKLRAKSNGTIYGDPDYVIKVDDRYQNYTSLLDILATVPGVTIMGGVPVFRGVSSLYGNIGPLILVDNIPVHSDILTQISPYDVERIEILKSPSKLAMFGSRGANGVISIFTKHGEFNTAFAFHFIIPGFLQQREFPAFSDNELHKRTKQKTFTLYWSDNSQANGEGILKIKNNSAYKGSFLRIEGISQSGKLIFFEQKL
jgi:TonB-dependent SusC/RagA subfamily outer membrane receptor